MLCRVSIVRGAQGGAARGREKQEVQLRGMHQAGAEPRTPHPAPCTMHHAPWCTCGVLQAGAERHCSRVRAVFVSRVQIGVGPVLAAACARTAGPDPSAATRDLRAGPRALSNVRANVPGTRGRDAGEQLMVGAREVVDMRGAWGLTAGAVGAVVAAVVGGQASFGAAAEGSRLYCALHRAPHHVHISARKPPRAPRAAASQPRAAAAPSETARPRAAAAPAHRTRRSRPCRLEPAPAPPAAAKCLLAPEASLTASPAILLQR